MKMKTFHNIIIPQKQKCQLWKTMPKNNNKILEARLTRLETRQEEIQNDIKEIKEQVFNALPHKISNLENKIMPKNNRLIAKIETDVSWLKERVEKIEDQVFNALPHKIDELESRFITGLIIAIVSFIVVQLLLRLF